MGAAQYTGSTAHRAMGASTAEMAVLAICSNGGLIGGINTHVKRELFVCTALPNC